MECLSGKSHSTMEEDTAEDFTTSGAGISMFTLRNFGNKTSRAYHETKMKNSRTHYLEC